MEPVQIKEESNESKSVELDQYATNLSSIQAARKLIQAYSHVTPVLTSFSLDSLAGRHLFFKCEIFQKGGAFKFRGACNAIFSLEEDVSKKGVVTHSSGNHAAAVALAAHLRGISAHIVIPNNAPSCKVENVRRYGGEVIFCEPSLQAREAEASRVHRETGGTIIHPFNDGRIISGQGTIALEFLEQVPQLDAIIAPISGGGLVSGIAVAAKFIKPGIRVFAAEPAGANDAAQSKIAGKIIQSPAKTIADGLRAWLGDLTWPIVRDLADDILVVDDKDIVQAMVMCCEVLKVVVEPSGAIGLAGVLSDQFRRYPECENVGIVLSGGNVDLTSLWEATSVQLEKVI